MILAGGLGTRLQPLTSDRPKSLVEVAGKPFLQLQLELLRAHGLTRIVLCVGHQADQIISRFGTGTELGVAITYSQDGDIPLGTGGALVNALTHLKDWFLVLDGDSYLPIDFEATIADFTTRQPLALMTVFRNENRYGRSNVAIKDGWVSVYDRKEGDFAYMHAGLTIFRRKALEGFPTKRFMLMDAIYQKLVADHSLASFELRQRFYEVGSHSGLRDLEEYLKVAGSQLQSISHSRV